MHATHFWAVSFSCFILGAAPAFAQSSPIACTGGPEGIVINRDVNTGTVIATPKTPNDRARIEALRAHMNQWRTHLGQPLSSPIETDLAQLAPDAVADLLVLGRSKLEGPNCFNTAMIAAELTPNQPARPAPGEWSALRRLTYGEYAFAPQAVKDFTHFVESPVCQPVTRAQDRAPGDVAILMHTGGMWPRPSHAFIWVGDDVTFSKASFRTDSDYSLKDLRAELNCYGVKPACAFAAGNPNPGAAQGDINDSSVCERWVNYYHCATWSEVLGDLQARQILRPDDIAQMNTFEAEITHVEAMGAEIARGKKILSAETAAPIVAACASLPQRIGVWLRTLQEPNLALRNWAGSVLFTRAESRCGDEVWSPYRPDLK